MSTLATNYHDKKARVERIVERQADRFFDWIDSETPAARAANHAITFLLLTACLVAGLLLIVFTGDPGVIRETRQLGKDWREGKLEDVRHIG